MISNQTNFFKNRRVLHYSMLTKRNDVLLSRRKTVFENFSLSTPHLAFRRRERLKTPKKNNKRKKRLNIDFLVSP